MYRRALRIRRAAPSLGEGPLEWLEAPEGRPGHAPHRTGRQRHDRRRQSRHPAVHLPAQWGVDVRLASSDDVVVLATDDDVESLAVGAETALWLGSTS